MRNLDGLEMTTIVAAGMCGLTFVLISVLDILRVSSDPALTDAARALLGGFLLLLGVTRARNGGTTK